MQTETLTRRGLLLRHTTLLVSHLKTEHPELYKKFESQKAQEMEEPTTSTSTKVKQLTLFESRDCVRVQDINVPLALRVHRLVGEMITTDTQPFSVMENEGFTNLPSTPAPRYSLPSRKYMLETVLHQIMAGVTAYVKLEITNVQWFSFTRLCWAF